MKGHIKYIYTFFNMSLPGDTDDIQTAVQLAAAHLGHLINTACQSITQHFICIQ